MQQAFASEYQEHASSLDDKFDTRKIHSYTHALKLLHPDYLASLGVLEFQESLKDTHIRNELVNLIIGFEIKENAFQEEKKRAQ